MSAVRRELESVLEHLEGGRRPKTTPEERLVLRERRKKRALRGHTRSFALVNGFLFLLWLTLALSTGSWFPWFVFPFLGWGLGYSFHLVETRTWLSDNRAALVEARRQLGLPSGATVGTGDLWTILVQRCRASVEETLGALQAKDTGSDARERLVESMGQVEALADSARDMEAMLQRILPSGLQGLRAQIAEAEMAWSNADDPQLKTAHAQNRALLQTRLKKVEQLVAERDRIAATLEGFILAAENLRLDAVRFVQGDLEPGGLMAPIQRIQDEVDILDKVRAELAALHEGG
ncbi:MAG: 2TM domain-containing protein [Myxococcota bacterium]